MTLRRKIILWWSAILLMRVWAVVSGLHFLGALSGGLLLLSRLSISFVSRALGWFAFALLLAGALSGVGAVFALMHGMNANVPTILWAISAACVLIFEVVVAISDFLSYRENRRVG